MIQLIVIFIILAFVWFVFKSIVIKPLTFILSAPVAFVENAFSRNKVPLWAVKFLNFINISLLISSFVLIFYMFENSRVIGFSAWKYLIAGLFFLSIHQAYNKRARLTKQFNFCPPIEKKKGRFYIGCYILYLLFIFSILVFIDDPRDTVSSILFWPVIFL